jgi:hypothetical protein
MTARLCGFGLLLLVAASVGHPLQPVAAAAADAADADDQPSSLALIGAGFGRTGTSSTMAALEQLGFGKVLHMVVVFERLAFGIWGRIGDASSTEERRALLREALSGYRSSIDFPSCYYYKDLMEMYPDAKVLLTTRSAESWAESALGTILFLVRYRDLRSADVWSSWRGPGLWLFIHLNPIGRGASASLKTPFSYFEAGDYAAAFRRWEAEVEATVPPERLLKFNVKEGWGPLAKFLGVAAPETPFPNINDSTEYQSVLNGCAIAGYATLVVVVLVVYFVGRALRRRFSAAAAVGGSSNKKTD